MSHPRTGSQPAPWKLKTDLCTFFASAQGCQRGSDCWFAHGAHELREPLVLKAAGQRALSDPAGLAADVARQLTAALQAAVAEAAAAGRVEGSPAAWQHLLAARRLLEQAPVLDAAQLLQARSAQQQLGPELCAMLRDLETSAHEVWAAVSRALDAQGDEQRGQQIQQQQQQQQQYPLPSPIPIMPGQPPGLAPAPSFYFGAAQPQPPPPPPPQAQPVRPTLADVLDSIRAGSLTEALLRAGAWQEPDADSMFWEAAVQACDVEALQVLLKVFSGWEWTNLATDEHLVFSLVERAQQLGWFPVVPVLQMAVAADPEVVRRMEDDDEGNKELPLVRALRGRMSPPSTVVKLLVPQGQRSAWEKLQVYRGEELAIGVAPVYSNPAHAYLKSIREEDERREAQEAAQRREAREAARKKQEQEAEQQRLAAQAELLRIRQEAEQRRLAAEAARRLRMQEAAEAAAQQKRQQEAAEAAERERFRLSPRVNQMMALTVAASDGNLPLLRERWGWKIPSRDEAVAVMHAAMVSVCLPAVKELRQLWSRKRHGHWHDIALDSDGVRKHVIFALVQLKIDKQRDPERLKELCAILTMLLQASPALASSRGPDAHTPLGAALHKGAPMEVIKALAPPSLPAAVLSPTGIYKSAVELAEQLASWQQHWQWQAYFREAAAYFKTLKRYHDEKMEAERRQRVKTLSAGLRDAVAKLRGAAEAGSADAVTAALPAVLKSEFKEVHGGVLPLGGLCATLESHMRLAPNLEVLQALEAASRGYGGRTTADPGFAAELLGGALAAQRFELAQGLLLHCPAAVDKLGRPPVCLALRHEAPTALISSLVALCKERRASSGGAAEADASVGHPGQLAIQQGRQDVVEMLLSAGMGLECGTAQKRTTLLCHAVEQGRGTIALHLLRHAQDTLGDRAAVAAYVDTRCGGATALFRAVDQIPESRPLQPADSLADHLAARLTGMEQVSESGLVGRLLAAGADPAIVCRAGKGGDEMTAVHLAAQRGHKKLALRLLDAVPKGQRPELLALPVGRPPRTLLHMALQSDDQPLVARLLSELDRERKQRLLQLAVEDRDGPLLRLLVALPGVSAAGVSLHAAIGWLPRELEPLTPLELVQWLVKAGASINQRDVEDGSLPTHKAVRAADLDLLDWLLAQEGVNIEGRDKQGNTVLHWSTVHCPTEKREEVMRLLVTRHPRLLAIRNHDRKDPSEYAKSKKPKAILRKLEEELRETRPQVAEEVLDLDPELEAPVGGGGGSRGGGGAAGKRSAPQEEEVLTRLGPKNEPEARKRQRIEAMVAALPDVFAALREQEAAASAAAAAAAASATAAAVGGAGRGGADGGSPEAATAATAAEPAGPEDEAAALRGVVEAAVAQTMPDAVPGAAEHADDAFSDDDDEEAGGGAAELAAAVDAAALPCDMSSLSRLLAELPWEFTITRDAWHAWLGMDSNYRRMVLLRVQQIGQGLWAADGKTKRLMGYPPTLELWRTKLTKGGRIVFEVAADYSEAGRSWRDILRLWVITLDHKRYEEELEKIADSHRKSHLVRDGVKLVARPVAAAAPASHQRLPTYYDAEESEAGEEDQGGGSQAGSRPGSATGGRAELRRYYPPASAGHNNYTLLKFYKLSSELVRAVMLGLDESGVEFSFRVSPEEQRIIELVPDPPRTIILLGRSGTGKTTCSVFRMWTRWFTAWNQSQVFNQVFVTASATLQEQVARSFGKLRAAIVPEMADVFAEAAAKELHSLKAVPDEAFPLFLSSRQFLRLLDGTIERPFFPRRADGSIAWARSEGEDFDPDGMNLRVELDAAADMEFEDESDEEEDDASDDEEGEVLEGGQAAAAGAVTKWQRQEVTFPIFQDMWKLVASKELRTRLKPGLVWTEIISYIKGSAEAVKSPEGRLGLEQYLEIGRKRAPNFDCDSRRLVYQVCEAYQRYKKIHGRYDNPDVVSHVYRQLAEQGYHGVTIHSLYRDEVQDFTQGELLMDLRLVADPNGLFLCGDTAQTISRGVGFRFTDIQTMFWEERQVQLALEGGGGEEGAGQAAVAAQEVHMPLIEHLKVNYRTHSGILEVASSVVDALRRFFPQHIDHLDRERALFPGPKPLLLSTVTHDDLAILLSWSDQATSQVEFGAHQVVLVRSMDSAERLPEGLRDSNALVLTVPQSKGLEFDDVFLVNFCSESLVKDEWRILLQYLEELEELEASKGVKAMPGKRPLLPAQEAAASIGELGRDALRTLKFDPGQHKLLCEELKHLYTAITRAKNSVVIYDENATARAPLYYFLARRGLARVVARSLMDEGVDSKDLGITKGRSTPADWAAQGYNLLDKGLFEAAGRCFERAGDVSRQQYCLCRHRLSKAKQQQETAPHEAKAAWFGAGYELLALAVNGQPLAELLPAAPAGGAKKGRARASAAAETLEQERRGWVMLAALALQQAGEVELAVRLWMALRNFKRARQLLASMGDPTRLAACCCEAAESLRAQGRDDLVVPWLAEAVRQYHALRQYHRCFDVLEQEPAVLKLLQRKSPAALEEIGVNAMRELHAAADSGGGSAAAGSQQRHPQKQRQKQGPRQEQHGERLQERLVAASRLILNPDLRANRLEAFGCWEELATVVKDPVRAAQLRCEHGGYPAGIARLLEAAQADRLPSAGLRLLHRLVAAAGEPGQVAASWGLLDEARGGSLAAELPRMRADLALRLACQLARLHPITALPLPPPADGSSSSSSGSSQAADAQQAAAVAAALLVAASLPEAEPEAEAGSSGVGGDRGSSNDDEALALAQRLAAYAAGIYSKADAAVRELQCLAVQAAAGGPPAAPQALQRGLQAAELVLGRCVLVAPLSAGQARQRPASKEEAAALRQVEAAFHLSRLADGGGTAGSGGTAWVTCPGRDPGLPALAELFGAAAAVHGSQHQLRVLLRRQAPAQRAVVGGSGQGQVEVQAAEQATAQLAAAFYLYQLAHGTAAAHLATQVSSGAAPAAASPAPGLRARGSADQAAAALGALGVQFRALERVHRLRDQARRLFPRLKIGGGGGKAAASHSLADVEAALVQAVLQAAFPAGPVDALPAALDVARLLRMDTQRLASFLRSRFLRQAAPAPYPATPDAAFDLWRALTVLLGLNKTPQQVFAAAARAIARMPQDAPEQRLIIRVEGRQAVPAMLLVEAADRLQIGLAPHAVDAMLFYLERCFAAAAAAAPAGAGPALPLGAEQTAWLLELLCGLACVACVGRRGGGAAFLPRSAADMLTQLPFLSVEHTAADLHFHAEKLAAAGPAKLHAMWRRMACLLSAAARALAAQVSPAAAGDGAGGGGPSDAPTPGQAAAAAALLGRLALAASSVLASQAMAAQQAGGEAPPPEVPGALYAAVQAADAVLPGLRLHRVPEAKTVGSLAAALEGVANSLGTAVMQLSPQGLREFDGFPRKGPGSQLAIQPIPFRAKALKARDGGAGGASRLPPLAALREHAPGGSAEVRRAKAALVIAQCWRAHCERRRRRGAMLVLKGLFFRQHLRGWLAGVKARREQEVQEQAERAEREHLRAAAQSDATADDRYTWLERELQAGRMVSAAECPICAPEALQPAPGGAEQPAAAGGGGGGGGLNVSAPSFQPHLYTPGHAAQQVAFHQFVQLFRESLAPELMRAHGLSVQLDGITEGAAHVHACTQQAALEPLVRKAHAVLGAVEARRRWQDAEPVLGAAAELGAACEGVQAALSRYAEGEAAAAAAASAGEGGQAAYTQHERQAAELQAALAAAAAAQQGLEGDDGWATVSRGGGSRLADEQEPEDELGDGNAFELLDVEEAWEEEVGEKKKKKRTQRGGQKRRNKKG